ncbi:hypothetical protein Y1Q_0001536 [Alligator mississippiensis]|uniref:Uncharacterized protein n=1 Tax=Alligator mississippiensis TaxID=8496 RepID=A0A151M9T4_ALLMI|nr:hypothetical protein Y1Q_0001536 [Alligator mississippiensis]
MKAICENPAAGGGGLPVVGGFHSSPWLEPLSVHWLPMTSDPSRPCTFAPRLPHRLQDLERFPFSKPFAPCSSPSLSA